MCPDHNKKTRISYSKITFRRCDENSEIATLYYNDNNIHALPTSLMMMTNAISKNNYAGINIQVSGHSKLYLS